MITSKVTVRTSKVKKFNVFAHDLRTKDETKCFEVKASSVKEAKEFFIEDFPKNRYYIQEIELA